ncbi:MAG: DegT/DnrJ/EryC1/StrS family aminotransferase [bacterium]|jgi:perosamine synthetase|nr:DegT/DnrJ/EryC1/StrS family aminotransferase [bacterium]MDD3805108.1 DegT/DnrJ/EryC1/StrS family aminotransferase [bacterium]MDD4152880.1 DegT/DnrJ/EryC1/StrS family aminotransferase [bacterium]MDD4558919.1 DegT/DnrJ/EryC1/StrS family aminotransferase [bacterium]
MSNKKDKYTGSDTDGGITSSYTMDDGVDLKVPYSFFGSIYDEDEKNMTLQAMGQDTLTMGPQVQAFQKEFAAMHDVKHAFAVTNCTTAMHVATQVFGIKPGDEVIVTPNTFIATSLVILKEGGIPVYADIDPRTYNIDPKEIEKKITNKTKAIYVVHYGGLMCDMDPIMAIARKHNLYVLEDCAHTPGAAYKGRKAGSIGDIGCFSFHSLKNMTTCGEGGMITTNNDDFVDPIEKLRCMNLDHWKDQVDYWIPSHFDVVDVKGYWGNNYRMNEVQAAVGRAQLRKLDMLNEKRRELGRRINDGIQGIKGITPVYESPDCYHVYHLYTLCVEEEELGASRDDFMRVLYREEGVQGILHYQPTYHFTGLKRMGYGDGLCPLAEKFFYKRELNLPMHPRLTDREIEDTIAGIRNAAEKVRRK